MVILFKKGQDFPTHFVIPIETINGKPFGNAFLHIERFSAYSKQPCSAQEHSQADHCKGYRNSTATHVSPTDSCLTERETYLEPPISGGTSPAGWRQLYVSDIKPYGRHSRRGHRRTACFHTPLVKPKRSATALARSIQILSHTTVDPQRFHPPRIIQRARDGAQSSPRQSRQARVDA